ncbi:hypothetical protein [Pseudomonas benzenivorans]|nr:hypothetical protein [Pseudomonas benzenivorans]
MTLVLSTIAMLMLQRLADQQETQTSRELHGLGERLVGQFQI